MKPLLIIMNPRRIPEAMLSIGALDIDKAWLSCFWEKDLEPVIDDIVDNTDYTHFLLLADDTIPEQPALDLVLGYLPNFPVVTAYCNNDVTSPNVNITTRPFENRERSVWEDYHFYTREEADGYPDEIIPSYFAGACLTGMSKAFWRCYPFRAITHDGEPRGYSSDWSLSVRLQKANIPIVAPRGAFVKHLKEKVNSQVITNPEHRLWVGSSPSEVRWQLRGQNP